MRDIVAKVYLIDHLNLSETLITETPTFGDDVRVDYARETGEMYKRATLSGEFTFTGEEYDSMYLADINDPYRLDLYERIIDQDSLICSATFRKTDITFNIDDKIARVSPTILDDYEKILAGKDNEYNLISLAPALTPVKSTKRAILQVYEIHSGVIQQIVGNVSHEVSVNPEVDTESLTDSIMTNTYKFEALRKMKVYNIENIPTSEVEGGLDINGVYAGTFDGVNGTYTRLSGDGYYILQQSSSYLLYDNNGNRINHTGATNTGATAGVDSDTIAFVYGSGIRWFELTTIRRYSYGRVISDHYYLDSEEIPSTDLSADNQNYRYIYSITQLNDYINQTEPSGTYDVSDLLMISTSTSVTPTKWGVSDSGEYFVCPTVNPNTSESIPQTDNVIPVNQSLWGLISLWFDASDEFVNGISYYDETFAIKEGISIGEAIRLLLGQIDPSVSFSETASYSQFLYSLVNPISGFSDWGLYMTPITNVKKTRHETPAQKGNITLSSIFDMLRAVFNCYWQIERITVNDNVEKRLRIEHIQWFRNGGSYTPLTIPSIDYTGLECPLPEKEWSYGQNTISYDTGRLYKRYEFEWAESCSEAFNGYPIDMKDAFLEDSGTLSSRAGFFIADIDMILAVPSKLGDDTWALMYATSNSLEDRYVPILEIGIGYPYYSVQNGYLAFLYAESHFWNYDISGSLAYVQQTGVYLSVVNRKRAKAQTILAPLVVTGVFTNQLVTTGVGTGEIDKVSIVLDDGAATFNLLFETE